MLLRKRVLGLLAAIFVIAGCSSTPLSDLDADPAGTDKGNVTLVDPAVGGGRTDGLDGSNLNGLADDGGPATVARVIYFDFDSYAIRPEFQSTLEQHARFLRENPSRRLMIAGHTDERGGREYNLALGQRRAEAVQRALGTLGVAASQMESVSYGKEKPANPGHDEEAMAQNRRAELSYR